MIGLPSTHGLQTSSHLIEERSNSVRAASLSGLEKSKGGSWDPAYAVPLGARNKADALFRRGVPFHDFAIGLLRFQSEFAS